MGPMKPGAPWGGKGGGGGNHMERHGAGRAEGAEREGGGKGGKGGGAGRAESMLGPCKKSAERVPREGPKDHGAMGPSLRVRGMGP